MAWTCNLRIHPFYGKIYYFVPNDFISRVVHRLVLARPPTFTSLIYHIRNFKDLLSTFDLRILSFYGNKNIFVLNEIISHVVHRLVHPCTPVRAVTLPYMELYRLNN